MSVPARLAGFAAILVLAFARRRVRRQPRGRPSRRDRGRARTRRHGMEAMAPAGRPRPGRLRATASRSSSPARRATAGERFELAFRIADRDGRTVRDFDVEHTKRMHVIVVRRDLTGFQHLHPVQRADGSWSVPVTLADPGTYRVFADFSRRRRAAHARRRT